MSPPSDDVTLRSANWNEKSYECAGQLDCEQLFEKAYKKDVLIIGLET
jgi:hypothetical protein